MKLTENQKKREAAAKQTKKQTKQQQLSLDLITLQSE